MEEVRLKDIVWGGRLRSAYRGKIWKIARNAAESIESSVSGSMVSSAETVSINFLDGGVTRVSGYFGPSSGTFWSGTLAKSYILYKLGLDPKKLLKIKDVTELVELEKMVNKKRKQDDPDDNE